jgi:3-oxoacyl-[acyl-carrier protein] reductase
MFMSVVTADHPRTTYPELAGARVLIIGLTSGLGVDLARGFADLRANLVIQSPENSPEITELAAVLTQSASSVVMFNEPFASPDNAVRFTQNAVASTGNFDCVVNLVAITPDDCAGLESERDIEDLVSDKLLTATLVTRVAGNRMRLTWTEGSILNVVLMSAPANSAQAAVAGVVRTALAAMTRGEAQAIAGDAVRVNAVGPKATMFDAASGACLTSEPDIAELTMYLASKKGRQLTGHVFDAEGVAGRGC